MEDGEVKHFHFHGTSSQAIAVCIISSPYIASKEHHFKTLKDFRNQRKTIPKNIKKKETWFKPTVVGKHVAKNL